jgi:hypothetical protein
MKEARHATDAMNGSDNGGMAAPFSLHQLRTAMRSGLPAFLRETVRTSISCGAPEKSLVDRDELANHQ